MKTAGKVLNVQPTVVMKIVLVSLKMVKIAQT